MRFQALAERELRAAARHEGLYRLRWITATAALVLLLWLGWEFHAFQNPLAGSSVFHVFAGVLFFYCLVVGAAGTADGLSRERRDGTLGLLFLTNLDSRTIVAGKLCANAVGLTCSLVATLPILALPVLFGGITLGEFWRTVLALLDALFFGMAAGFAASSMCIRQFPAIALATAWSLVVGMGFFGLAQATRSLGFPSLTGRVVVAFSPMRTLMAANDAVARTLPSVFWISFAAVAGLSLATLGLAAWRIGRTWRDRPEGVRWWRGRTRGPRTGAGESTARRDFRHRLLAWNPFFWLAGRQRVSAPVFMVVTVVLHSVTSNVLARTFSRIIPAGAVGPLAGQLIAWFCFGLALHACVLYYAALVAAQRLAEDKQTGALELILSTPISEREISGGLWWAYARRMMFPAVAATLVHGFFLWQVLTLMVIQPPGNLPVGATPWQIYWSAVLDLPLRGQRLDWEFGMILRGITFAWVAFAANWIMLGWLGRWLGLRMRHPGFAPLAAVMMALAPPTLVFSLFCFLVDRTWITRLPERQIIPLLVWLVFALVMANGLGWSLWAAGKLRREFRATVTRRLDPPSPGVWWKMAGRLVLRVTLVIVAAGVVVALFVSGFYGYQGWRSRRQWAAFQQELKQRGESLDLFATRAAKVPDPQNFARSAAVQRFIDRMKSGQSVDQFFRQSFPAAVINPDSASTTAPMGLTPWMAQAFLDLERPALLLDVRVGLGPVPARAGLATIIRDGLQRMDGDFATLAAAPRWPYFQVAGQGTVDGFFDSNRPELRALEYLHYLSELRASVRLELSQPAEAVEDVMTSLRLTALARQSIDLKSSVRVQHMLGRSLQPIWEGLARHQWNEPQLAKIQQELAGFNLLADHTNAVQRAVLASLAFWQSGIRHLIPAPAGLSAAGVTIGESPQVWPQSGWALDNCRQLYLAGQKARARVDVASSRVAQGYDWEDFDGLALGSIVTLLLQQPQWTVNSLSLVSFAQTSVNQAVIACALERYRLAHGVLPLSLEQLNVLDNNLRDTSRGRPMIYTRIDDHQFSLSAAGGSSPVGSGLPSTLPWRWAYSPVTNAARVVLSPRK